jgi:hypothetical protein
MGEIYRARDTTLGRDVALKILPAAFASDPDRLMRFEREARTLASLNQFFVGGDGQLASASLVSGATPAVGQIKPLFPIRTNAQANATNHYRVSHDAQGVLVLGDRVEDERGVTLVLNWPQLIGRSAR